MKHLLPQFILLCSALLLSTAAQAAPAPADTVAGQAHLIKLMSAGMCTKLTQEGQQTDLAKLTPPESEALLKKLLLSTLGDNITEFSALLEKIDKAKAAELSRTIGEQAVFDLAQSCSNAGPLLAKIGGSHMPGGNVELTAAERNLLLPITQDACDRLTAENTKQPLAQRTPAQRATLFGQVMQGVFMSHSEALTQQYGDEVLQDQTQAAEIGKKIGLLMVELCPTYIMQVGRDHLAQQRAAATPPPAVSVKKPTVKAKAAAPKVRK